MCKYYLWPGAKSQFFCFSSEYVFLYAKSRRPESHSLLHTDSRQTQKQALKDSHEHTVYAVAQFNWMQFSLYSNCLTVYKITGLLRHRVKKKKHNSCSIYIVLMAWIGNPFSLLQQFNACGTDTRNFPTFFS